MQIRAITVNAAGLAQERGIQGNMSQVQPEKKGFDPEYRVTISREGRELSRQQAVRQTEGRVQDIQNVEAGKTLTGRQEEFLEIKKAMEDAYRKLGYKGDELRERTEIFYEIFCRTNPFRGEAQQIMAEEPTEEEMAAMDERARQSKENLDKILKGLTPADFAGATPLTFDHAAALPHVPENESLE